MTVKELKAFFKEHLVPSRLYNLKGGSHGGRICLGKNNPTAEGSAWERTSRTAGKCTSAKRRERSASCSSPPRARLAST